MRSCAVFHALVALVLFLMGQPAWASVPVAAALCAPMGAGELALGRYTLVLEERGGARALAQVASDRAGWRPMAGDTFQPGIASRPHWLRLRVCNPGAARAKAYVDFRDNLQDYLDIHVVDASGRLKASWRTGDRRPFGTRPVKVDRFVVPIELEAGASAEVFVRIASHDGLVEAMTPTLRDEAGFIADVQQRYAVNGAYAALVGALILYNAFIYLSARVSMVGAYALYSLTFLLWSFTFYGASFQLIWPDSPAFNNHWLALSACIAHWAGLGFVYKYLASGTPVLEAEGRRVARVFRILLVVPTLCALCGFYMWTFATLIPVSIAMIGFVLFWSLAHWRRGNSAGKYVILASSALGLGVVVYFLRVAGVLPSNAFTENCIQVGSMLEVLLVSFGVADQINLIQVRRIEAERKAKEAQASLNHDLDSLVRQRTRSLEEANRSLHALSVTDALTKTFNRRSFDEDLGAMLAKRVDAPATLVLCYFDIDHFKWINDNLGHQRGDEVLKAVAATAVVIGEAHGGRIYRTGGEEFGIIFPMGCRIDDAFGAVERIRAAIQALGIAHRGNPAGVVTASFGVIGYEAGSDIPDVASEHPCVHADRLLYEAKHAGRNAVAGEVLHDKAWVAHAVAG